MRKTKNIHAVEAIAVVCKQLRKKKDVTQLQVKADIGINISRIEARKFDITVGTLYTLCEYFEVNASEFFHLVEAVDPKLLVKKS